MANVPIQSLIDHIKTAVDVDPWAKEMAEELLKEQEPLVIHKIGFAAQCPECQMTWMMWQPDNMRYCPGCGRKVKWDDT